jgi:hypothetical protein
VGIVKLARTVQPHRGDLDTIVLNALAKKRQKRSATANRLDGSDFALPEPP